MKGVRVSVGLLALLFVTLACESDDGDTGGDSTGGNAGANGETPIEQPDAGKSICDEERPPVFVESIAGTWAYAEVQSQVVQSGGFADPFRNLVITTQLWELNQDGDRIEAVVDVCDRYVRGGGIIETTLSDAFVSSIESFEITGTYGDDGSFDVDRFYLLLGATLEDPADKSSLPTEPDDERVFDQDEDGNPGVTVRIQGLGLDERVYNAQWSTMAPAGATVSDDRIEGLLHHDAQENVLSASSELVAAIQPQSTPHPDPCWSTFQMVRLEAGATCSTVQDSLLELFPDLESTNP